MPRQIKEINMSDIVQVRVIRTDKNNADLLESMQEIGLINPVGVKQIGDKYHLYLGNRRFETAKLLGWGTIRALIMAEDDDPELMAIDENFARKKLSTAVFMSEMEKLKDIRGDISKKKKKAFSKVSGMSRRSTNRVANIIQHASPKVKEDLRQGKISLDKAEALAKGKDLADRVSIRFSRSDLKELKQSMVDADFTDSVKDKIIKACVKIDVK